MPFVVLTRDATAAAPYASVFATLGLESIAMPVTRTAPPANPDALTAALTRPHDVVMIASQRAAVALVEASVELAGDVWAVGPATARVLADHHVAVRQPDAGVDIGALARAILAAYPDRPRVLVPRAEDGRDEGIEILRAAGAIVDEVIAYRTIASLPDDPAIAEGRARLAAGEVAVCVVFAPSQVTALVALVGPLPRLATTFAAIGQTTATALLEAGITRVAIASAPTPAGMAAAVAAVYPPGR